MKNSTKKIIIVLVAVVIIAVCYWLYKRRKAASATIDSNSNISPVKTAAKATTSTSNTLVAPSTSTGLPNQQWVNIDPWSRLAAETFSSGNKTGSAEDTQLIAGYGSVSQPVLIVPKQY